MAPTGLGVAGEVIRIVVEPDTFVAIAGTSTGGSMFSRVTITNTKDGIDHYLGGDGGSNVLVLDGSTDQNCLTFDPVSERTSFWIVFEAAKKGTTDYVDAAVDPDYKDTKHVIDGYATYYTFHAEDGGDDDYKDCILAVALIAATK